MQCLVTGGAGFIGSHVADFLLAHGFDVVVLDNLSTGRRENVHPQATFVQADITRYEQLEQYCRDCDYLFHLAALPRIQPSFEDPVGHDRVNVHGTLNLLLACRNTRLKKFVYSSSSAVYGTPDIVPTAEDAPIRCENPYALHKYAAEQYCLMLGKRYGIPVVSLRYFNVYGPRSYNPEDMFNAYSPVIGIFLHRAANHQPLSITGDGKQSRDFIHVADIAAANLAAARSMQTGEVYNVGFGRTYAILDIARRIAQDYEFVPERPGEARRTLADIGKIKRKLGWQPQIDLDRGLAMMREHGAGVEQ
jgi:UDP-glucose 4-epimerase